MGAGRRPLTPASAATRLTEPERPDYIRSGAFHVRRPSRPNFPIRGDVMPIRQLGNKAPVNVPPNIREMEPVRRTSDYDGPWDKRSSPISVPNGSFFIQTLHEAFFDVNQMLDDSTRIKRQVRTFHQMQ